uniref:Uncharacterized protein n=1 Tax=Nitratidesulfovibrio vulgaris (strain DSM 19637 / Miyazaki F) TaxID=883 RepID=B8DJS9_NITV9
MSYDSLDSVFYMLSAIIFVIGGFFDTATVRKIREICPASLDDGSYRMYVHSIAFDARVPLSLRRQYVAGLAIIAFSQFLMVLQFYIEGNSNAMVFALFFASLMTYFTIVSLVRYLRSLRT